MNAPLRDSQIRLSADVGGTFTDVAAFDEQTGALRLGKTLTTPERLVTGIENGVGKAGSRFQAAGLFLHGTTVAINTILERKGARCALLNERYPEYAGIGPGHKLIWVVRNPYSVVYSMVYNWRRFALNELYESCGVKQGLESGAAWWTRGPSSIEKACRAYAGKAGQLESIVAMIDPGQLLVVDYDQLVRSPREHLAAIFDFAGAPFEPGYAARVRPDSLGKAKGMSAGAVAMIEKWATPVHSRCLSLVSLPKAA